MYVLYADSRAALSERTDLFARHFEPALAKLEASYRAGGVPTSLPEIPQYLKVCRWPFRQLEYSLALDVLLEHLRPGDRYLDAGSGVTPLGHILAAKAVQTDACDANQRLIDELRRFRPEDVFGSRVKYATQDLTRLSYADEMFDAVSCISVLEHIPAPFDQAAVREMLRVLKPGGVLVLTVDFTPPAADGRSSRLRRYIKRAAELARSGNLNEIGRGMARKVRAHQAIQRGTARNARSANQCFEVAHLEQDIAPLLRGEELTSRLSFTTDLRALTAKHARRFWDLESGLFDDQGRRAVLPAAVILRKAPVVELAV
jgi:ubiquinone/menaquinone biosynthesis C-methylase UbiE